MSIYIVEIFDANMFSISVTVFRFCGTVILLRSHLETVARC